MATHLVLLKQVTYLSIYVPSFIIKLKFTFRKWFLLCSLCSTFSFLFWTRKENIIKKTKTPKKTKKITKSTATDDRTNYKMQSKVYFDWLGINNYDMVVIANIICLYGSSCLITFTLFVFVCVQHILYCVFCFVFLRLVYHVMPVSLSCPFLISTSVFSNVYKGNNKITELRTIL